MLAWLALACGGDAPAPVAGDVAGGPIPGDTLVVAAALDPGQVNPLVGPFQLSGMISDLVQPGLVRRRVGADGLSYEPALAASWVWGDDGTTLTYTLRDDVAWGDGRPVTADDVVFTWQLIADPAVASNWLGTARHVTAVEAPDARTVVWRFVGPKNPILQQGYTIRGIVPRHQLEGADRATLRGHPSGRDPLPSGPFRVAAWEPGVKVVLEPNPRAPADWKPRLDRVVFRIIPEYATRLLELRNGGVDMVVDVEVADLAELEGDPRLRVERVTADAMEYIGWNHTLPMFGDVRVRRALTLSLDRDGLMRDLFGVGDKIYAQSCIGTIAPTLGAWYAGDVTPLPFDRAAAAALLDEAGWTDGDGDGVRDRDGQPLRFRLMVQNGTARYKRAAVIAQAQWKEVGVAVDIDLVEPARFSERAHQKQYEAMLWGFGANPKVDPSQEWRSDGPYNWFGYRNPAVDAKIDEGVAATDLAVAQAAFRDVQRLVYADQPVTFLFWSDGFLAMDKRFRDVETDTFNRFLHAERWWVPASEQRY